MIPYDILSFIFLYSSTLSMVGAGVLLAYLISSSGNVLILIPVGIGLFWLHLEAYRRLVKMRDEQ